MSLPTQADIETVHPAIATRAISRWWLVAAAWTASLGILAGALLVRSHHLGMLLVRDYDESVYWASLRSMQSGHALFSEIFSSQPPFFLLAEYPFFRLFGEDLLAARLGVLVISAAGLVGMMMIGRAIAGWLGQIAGLLLLSLNVVAVTSSRIVQADGPSIALATLAVGFIALWWRKPNGWQGAALASSSMLFLVLAVSTKFLAVSAIAPIGVLFTARIIQAWVHDKDKLFSRIWPIFVAMGVGLIAGLAIYLPYAGSFHEFYSQVVTFHNDAADAHIVNSGSIVQTVNDFIWGIGALSVVGIAVAVWQRNFLIVPMAAWLAATALEFNAIQPLFAHHLIAIIPPIIAMGIAAFGVRIERKSSIKQLAGALSIVIAMAIVGATSYRNLNEIHDAFGLEAPSGAIIAAADEVNRLIKPGNQVITDQQFIGNLADRDVPASLVDTSTVRIQMKYMTSEQLIAEGSKPAVTGVLFYSGRLQQPELIEFKNWVKEHFTLVHVFGKNRELWIKH